MGVPTRTTAALVGVGVVAGLLGLRALVSGDALGRDVGRETIVASAMTVGETAHFGGTLSLSPHKGTVAVRSVEVVGLPDGIEIVGIHGVNVADGSPRIGAGDGDPAANGVRLHPVSDVRVTAGENEMWYVLVNLRITRPGTWETAGLDVSWRQGWRRGTDRLAYRFRLTTEPQQ